MEECDGGTWWGQPLPLGTLMTNTGAALLSPEMYKAETF